MKKTNPKIFVNLPVKNLDKSIKFFTKLGFKFNPKFTDKNATCMIVGENMNVMLLVEKFFKKFTQKQIINAKKNTEVIISLMLESKSKVDAFIVKAIKAGGKEYRKPDDYGFMYQRSFEDLDGHQWEIFYMDEKKFPKK
ncbi:MAG: VOC family protein [Candidatus Nanoarchaeia archaeon]